MNLSTVAWTFVRPFSAYLTGTIVGPIPNAKYGCFFRNYLNKNSQFPTEIMEPKNAFLSRYCVLNNLGTVF